MFGGLVGSGEADWRQVVVCVFLCVNDAGRPAFDGKARATLTKLMLDIAELRHWTLRIDLQARKGHAGPSLIT